jgi:hypothetical protein
VGPYHYYSAEANLSEEFTLTALHNLRSADRSRQAALLNGRDAREMVVVAVSGSYLRVLATQALVASQEAQSNTRSSRTSRRSIRRTRAPKPKSMPTAALSKCRHSNGLGTGTSQPVTQENRRQGWDGLRQNVAIHDLGTEESADGKSLQQRLDGKAPAWLLKWGSFVETELSWKLFHLVGHQGIEVALRHFRPHLRMTDGEQFELELEQKTL